MSMPVSLTADYPSLRARLQTAGFALPDGSVHARSSAGVTRTSLKLPRRPRRRSTGVLREGRRLKRGYVRRCK